MRIRSTKPEFWRSERIASVDWETRLVLKGLESYVDDNGVGKDDLPLIVADVFPRDLSRNPTGTLQKVSEAISSLENAGLLWRYEMDGANLLFVSFWESIQRIEKPSKGRFRRPDGTLDYRDSVIGASFPEHSGNTPVVLREGSSPEQGNRGTGEQGRKHSATGAADGEFETWWSIYPRKVGKGQARKAYTSALKKASTDELSAAATAYAEKVATTEPRFIAHPATWLNGERWTDEPDGESGEQWTGVEGWMNG